MHPFGVYCGWSGHVSSLNVVCLVINKLLTSECIPHVASEALVMPLGQAEVYNPVGDVCGSELLLLDLFLLKSLANLGQ